MKGSKVRRPMTKMWLLWMMALGMTACGGGGQSPECKKYVECVAKLSGSSASVDSTYGPDGSCWADPTMADSCTKKCKTAVAAFPAGSDC